MLTVSGMSPLLASALTPEQALVTASIPAHASAANVLFFIFHPQVVGRKQTAFEDCYTNGGFKPANVNVLYMSAISSVVSGPFRYHR